MRSLLAHDFFAIDDAGAIDEALQAAESIDRRLNRRPPAGLVGNVRAHEAHGLAELSRQRIAFGILQIRDDGTAAAGDNALDRRRAKARRPTRHEKRAAR